jgi:3-methyladenine DNA glycosylase/8-oxoguanine DNA glycosylase
MASACRQACRADRARLCGVKLYQLGESPPKQTLLEIGARWSPFASIGSWYCWRYLDVLRSEKGQPAATPV